MPLNQRFNAVKKNFIAVGQKQLGWGADAPEIKGLGVGVDHTVSRDPSPWVYPKNNFLCHSPVLNDPILFEKGF
jgi:hypothetical protein